MIEVNGLTKYYADHIAIENLTFDVKEGEILGFLGPNGAGKSTTMKILTGLVAPSSGTATVAGHDVQNESLESRRCIGYLPETTPLYTDLTVRQYLDFMASVRGVAGKVRRARVDDVMEMTRVTDRADTIIAKLSKGYRQRVGLAQALVHDPPVLILDEPTSGLDPKQINETRALIRSLAGSHTVVLSSHILPEVSAVCQRVAILNEGRLVAEDEPTALMNRLQSTLQVVVGVRGPLGDVADALGALSGITEISAHDDTSQLWVTCERGSDPREAIASLVIERGWGLFELRPVTLSLEDIFLKLTTVENHDMAEAA